jgi:hypothetical protein
MTVWYTECSCSRVCAVVIFERHAPIASPATITEVTPDTCSVSPSRYATYGVIRAVTVSSTGSVIRRRSTITPAATTAPATAPPPASTANSPTPCSRAPAPVNDRLTGDDGARPRVVALCGLGGAGKTSVALEYAHRHLAEVELAWQFPAEDQAVLAAGFGELAAQLGAGDSRDPVASVHGRLASYPAQWLLVFDNAPDRAAVAAFVPPAGRAGC